MTDHPDAESATTGLLDGITVVEFTAYQSGTIGGALLGQFGARVIKIEQPDVGDPSRGMTHVSGAASKLDNGSTVLFETANSDKESVALNLGSETGRRLAHRLLAHADVFITNYRENILQRLTLDEQSVTTTNRDIIYSRASATGPADTTDARSFDWIGQARSGVMWACGPRQVDEPSIIVGGPVDQMGGVLTAMGVVLALLGRERLGIAQRVDVSLLGSALCLQTLRINQQTLSGHGVRRHGRAESRQPLSNWYRCADDRWILLCELQPDRFWQEFCDVVGLSDVADDPRFDSSPVRRKHYRDLIALLDEAFHQRSRDEWLRLFAERMPDFVLAPVLDIDEAIEDPAALANGYVTDIEHQSLGPQRLAASPITLSKTPATIRKGAPELGQHSEFVLHELLDLSWEEIATLHANDVL